MEHCVFLLWPDTGEPNQPLIDYLKIHKKAGAKLILWTCRSGVILDKALSWCKEIAKLEFDAVNDNSNMPRPSQLYRQ